MRTLRNYTELAILTAFRNRHTGESKRFTDSTSPTFNLKPVSETRLRNERHMDIGAYASGLETV
jgi:hypothetical protein